MLKNSLFPLVGSCLISRITGDLKDELAVFDWLISDDNRELDDAIEEVGDKMLLKLIDRSPFIAVYFCE